MHGLLGQGPGRTESLSDVDGGGHGVRPTRLTGAGGLLSCRFLSG